MVDEKDDITEINKLFGITEGTTTPATDPATIVTNPVSVEPVEPAPSVVKDDLKSQTESTDTTPTNNESESNTTETKTKSEDTQTSPEEKFTSKQGYAFAQMRNENKELTNLLMSLAKATGQNPNDVKEASEILKGGLTKIVAKNRNIPEDVLREMDEYKKTIADQKQKDSQQKAIQGFQLVKDKYGLTKEEVNSFADKLIEKSINPFEQEVSLEKEYRNMYFEIALDKAREQGRQEEIARSVKARQSSTTPLTQNGVTESSGGSIAPIKTPKDLSSFLDSLK